MSPASHQDLETTISVDIGNRDTLIVQPGIPLQQMAGIDKH